MVLLSDKEFKDIASYMRANFGIDLSKKKQLIEARMQSLLVEKNIGSFDEFFKLIKTNYHDEVSLMLNRLTTNHTFFLREPTHYTFFKGTILPKIVQTARTKEIRIWSAGCSSGEEAYTTVMVMKDFFGLNAKSWDNRILATDISTRVLDSAQVGVYNHESIKNIPPAWEKKYFKKNNDVYYSLCDEIKNEVIFKQFNLMDKFVFKKPFDLIFCRNVMIYFDQETKNKLINKFYDVLKPGGYLFIGHSETVQKSTTAFEYIQPSIYQKGVN